MTTSALHEFCHRIGGGSPNNLRLKPAEELLDPPGISVLLGGAAADAAADIRRVFGPNSSLGRAASIVGTARVEQVRAVGFDVIGAPTQKFPEHGRIIHPTEGSAGFTSDNLDRLSQAFSDTAGLYHART